MMVQMVNWSQTGRAATRQAHLFLSQSTARWRISNDVEGLDANSGVNEWGAWDCYSTDAETSSNSSNGRLDNTQGFGLLNAAGGSYSDSNTTCRILFMD